MIRTKILLLALILIAVIAWTAFSQDTATVRRILGKVEIQQPGQAWQAAAVGMELPLGATISTGFNSQAVIELGGSVLTLRALTRIRIDELRVREGVAVTGLSMPVGRIRAEVRGAEGLRTDFSVRGPVSTAAVRGTGFDDDGSTLFCFEDRANFENQAGIRTEVSEGETGQIAGLRRPSGGAPQRLKNTTVSPYTKGADERTGGITGFRDELGTGSILISWDLP
jgi:hypothetical protein